MSWLAVTGFKTIDAGTSLCIFAVPHVAGGPPPLMSIGTELTVEFADDARTMAYIAELSGAEAVVQLADGSRWVMERCPRDGAPVGVSWCGTPYQEWIIRSEVEGIQT
jgi:hypothetical protein